MLRTKVKYRRHCRALAIQGTLQMQRQNTTSLHGQLEQSKNTFKTIRIVLASEVPWPPVAAVPFSWGDRHGGGSGPAAGRKRERELAWIQAQRDGGRGESRMATFECGSGDGPWHRERQTALPDRPCDPPPPSYFCGEVFWRGRTGCEGGTLFLARAVDYVR
ncbi:unnamed protein product [Prorocentrum cordatum]|uniref:Uncharacterized protein n=1 Tax=Prorocentrum cordatum TaxID=2364126 RepID=A0ABN9RG81_9DINO|nr:unnamed protein product [Polarella glacialis]